MIDEYKVIRERFKVGDWVVGINKHTGCSEVFDYDTAHPQPFSYLNETDPNEFRLATAEEADAARSYIHENILSMSVDIQQED